jgi:hypothetical protein
VVRPARWLQLTACLIVAGACARTRTPDDATPAERTHFLHTATYDEAVDLLNLVGHRVHRLDSLGRGDTLRRPDDPIDLIPGDTTTQGRVMPVVVLARPMVRNGAEAHAAGRPVIYVEASMAGGEVDGKDAMLALVRDLVRDSRGARASILDSAVIVIVPMANPDGDGARAPVVSNRPNQRGPDTVGTDRNAQGLTLNRDFVKTEAPETRNTLHLFRTWDPDIYVELHTADGSYTNLAYTFAPPLHPGSVIAATYARDSILPELERRMRDRHALESFDYGTFAPPRGPGVDTVSSRRWETFDYRARDGTNYVGLRNRIAILGVSYAHDTFERRISEQKSFVREILSIVAERGSEVRRIITTADSVVTAWGQHPDRAPPVPLAAQVARGSAQHTILAEDLALTGDSSVTEAGVAKGIRRTGHFTQLDIPVWNRFDATRTGHLPAGWLLGPSDSALVKRLAVHGIRSSPVEGTRSAGTVEYFAVDSIVRDSVAFEGHRLEHVVGRWRRVTRDTSLARGSYVVSAAQPLSILTLELLDPESADGFVTWNIFDGDARFRPGGRFPIARMIR